VKKIMREDTAIVLDFLPNGYVSSFRKEAIVQALGPKYLSLLELVARDNVKININEEVYIGPEKREKIKFIKGRLDYQKLTATARNELKINLEKIASDKEDFFVNFFNKAGAITVRQHSLELLPGIGKKHMKEILKQREQKPFESFKDITDRINLMPDPKRLVVDRIIEEMSGGEKYYLFVKPINKNNTRNRRY